MSKQVARRWFDADEYYRMARAGILSEEDHVELIEGEVVQMSPIGSRHAACVGRLTELFAQARDRAIVWVQNPIHVDRYSEPVPDIALLKRRSDFYASSLPTPADVLLIVEVADSSLEYDRATKISLYARAGIPEMLLVSLQEDWIEHYSQPAEGSYQSKNVFKRGESFSTGAIEGLTLSATFILG